MNSFCSLSSSWPIKREFWAVLSMCFFPNCIQVYDANTAREIIGSRFKWRNPGSSVYVFCFCFVLYKEVIANWFFFWCTIYTLIIIYSPVQVSKTLNSKSLLLAYLEVIVADMYICCPRGGSNELREEPWEPWGSWDTGLHVSLKHNDLTYWWNVKCLLYRASNCDMMYKKNLIVYITIPWCFFLCLAPCCWNWWT